MVQGSLKPNITFLGQKLWPVDWKKILLVLYKEKSKDANKKRKNDNFEKQKKITNVLLGKKNRKNANKKRRNYNFEKNEFLSHVPRITWPKN